MHFIHDEIEKEEILHCGEGQKDYSTYTEKTSASENCTINNTHYIVVSFSKTREKCCHNALHEKHYLPAIRNLLSVRYNL